jgi:ectoine hydroxylase-related dioxygenase (phytanoyl-CoA dioxygenase family)
VAFALERFGKLDVLVNTIDITERPPLNDFAKPFNPAGPVRRPDFAARQFRTFQAARRAGDRRYCPGGVRRKARLGRTNLGTYTDLINARLRPGDKIRNGHILKNRRPMMGTEVSFEADDLSPRDLHPTRQLQACNDCLGNPSRMREFFEENGYLLFRDVLEREGVDTARGKMMKVLAEKGMVEDGADVPVWTGAHWGDLNEGSPEFGGLGHVMAQTPYNVAIFKQILGEPATVLPIVQYRFYPPNYSLGMPHQDGYFTQVEGFIGAWIPLADIDESMGGLTLAVGQNKRGYLHNTTKPAPSPIPRNAIPDDAWATTEFHPGDLLLIHRCTPHCALPNRSNRLRLSLDIRLIPQSSGINAFTGAVTAVTSRSISLRGDDGAILDFIVDDGSFLRCGSGSQGERLTPAQLPKEVPLGTSLLVLHENGRATMLRRAVV